MEQNRKLIRQKDLELWLENPITQELVDVILEKKSYWEEDVKNEMLYAKVKDIDLYVTAEKRGVISAMEQLADVRSVLQERCELPLPEVNI